MQISNHGGSQVVCILAIGTLIGGLAWAIQDPDFEAALAPPEEASAAEIEAVLNGVPSEDSELAKAEVNNEIPTSKGISFLDVASRFFGQKNVLFVDARDAGTFEAGHIPGAKNIDAEGLDSDLLVGEETMATVPKTHVVIVYCSGGQCDLSKRLATNLVVRGYQKVFVFEGGWNEWVEEGQPIEEGSGGEMP